MDKHQNYFEVRWKNFKSFKDTGWIKIKPITILLGINNSGKTNFIAPFSLLNQTITSRDPNSALIINGDIYSGGSFQELVNNYDLKKNIYFGYRYHIHKSDRKLFKIGYYPPGGIGINLGIREGNESDIFIKSHSIYDIFARELFRLTLQGKRKYKFSSNAIIKLTKQELQSITSSKPLNFLFTPNSLLSGLNRDIRKNEMTKRTPFRFSQGFSEMLDMVSFNFSRFREYIGDLSYIGPLRDRPHRIYEITNENYNTIGHKGENMASLLKKFKRQNKELDFWIKKFDFGDKIKLHHLYSNSYSIRFLKQKSKLYTSIANSGFGASQVLPLIVQSLVSPKDSLTIAEQPEIHLNPKLQCVLADLFVYMANQKQSVIIETHSEHMLLRLRSLIAENKFSADHVALYFVKNIDGVSILKEIKIENNGHIKSDEWPSGFFEDSLRESLSLAKSQLKFNAK